MGLSELQTSRLRHTTFGVGGEYRLIALTD
jgi:hypothetical protein